MKSDLDVIKNQTGVDQETAERAYHTCDQHVVNAIVYILSGNQPISEKPKPNLDPVQHKLQELRDIVNKKDRIFDTKIVDSKKTKQTS